MEKTPFKRFIELIAFDQGYVALEKELAQLMTSLEIVTNSVQTIEKELEKERGLVHDLRKGVDEQELTMKSLDEQEKVARERASMAATPREFQALTKEFEQYKYQQHEHEEKLVALWNKFEQAKKLLEAKEQAIKEQKTTLDEQLTDLTQKKEELFAKMQHHEKERKNYSEGLPEDWVEKYTRMRSLVANPIVGIVANTCGGCSFTLAAQVMMQLNDRKMISCSNCYRLMYKDVDKEA